MKKLLLAYFLVIASAFPQGSRPPVTTLSGLSDVFISSPANGQSLKYNSTTSKWNNGTIAVPALSDLSDVAVVSTASNQVLRYDATSSKWVNYGPMAFADLTGSVSPTQMNGGLGASASTYWKGDGTWGSIASAGTVTPTTNFLLGDGAGNAVDTVSGSPTVSMGLTGMSSTGSNNGDFIVNWSNTSTGANAASALRLVNADGYGEIKMLGSGFTAVGILTPDDFWIRQHQSPSGPKAGNLIFSTAGDQMRYSNDDGITLRMLVGNGLAVGSATDPGIGIINAQNGYRVANAAASGKILKGDGTNFIPSTETYAAPGANGNIMKSDGTNWTSAAPTSGGTVTSIAASSPLSVSPNPIVATGTVSFLNNVDLALVATQSIINSTLATTTVTNVLTLAANSTGVVTNGFGTGIKFQGESSTTNTQDMANIQAVWSDATHGSRTAYLDFQTANNPGTVASRMRLFGGGGLSVGSTVDPGSGIINANTGYWIGGTNSATGKILKSDGAKFTASTETYAAPGAAGKLMQSDGTNWTSSSMAWPTVAPATGKVLISNGTAIVASTPTFPNASATSGKVIQSDGTNWIASTPVFPTSVASTNKILKSDGTNGWVASTETYAAPGTSGNTMKSDGTNWTSAAPPAYATYQDTTGRTPTAITGTTEKMFGMGSNFQITPTANGKVLATIPVNYAFTQGGAYFSTMQMRYGTVSGGVPANGAGLIGGYISIGAPKVTVTGPGVINSPTFMAVVTGLTVGTAYWFDLSAFSNNAAGIANVGAASATIIEIP